MIFIRKLVLSVASAAFFVAAAHAQSGTVANHAVPIGKGPGVTGYTSLPPGTSGLPIVSNGASSDPSYQTLAAGALASNSVTNAKINPGAANTFKGSLNGSTTTDIALTACTLSYQITKWVAGTGWQCGINPVLPSRTVAASLDLSAFTGITTQGYALPGDGGMASYQKVAAGTRLPDSFVNCNPCTLAGGTLYTNGTYFGVALTGGGGLSCVAQVVVAGGSVTQVNFAVPCVTHIVGDVLTTSNASIGGTGSGFSYTVSSISTPTGSFTDSAGNLWQYTSNGFISALQFGCVGDWSGTDGAATNNTNCIWSATSFASAQIASAAANVTGNQIWFPRGAYMTCGGQFLNTLFNFPVPAGVTFTGAGVNATTMRQCAADPTGTHYIELCDTYLSVGEFGCKVERMTFDSSAITGSTSGISVIYSEVGQQLPLAENVNILAGKKGCIKYVTGKGGAANDIWLGINCVQADAATTAAFSFNASTTQHVLRNAVCASSPSGGASFCVQNLNGRLIVDTLDIEGYVIGYTQLVTVAGNNGVFQNVQQNSASCTAMVQLQSTNIGGNVTFQNLATSCPTTIQNAQSGGTSWTGNIRGPLMCVSGACAAAVP